MSSTGTSPHIPEREERSERTPVVVTGLGVVSSIGHDVATFTEGLQRGASGITRIQSASSTNRAVRVMAEIQGFSWEHALSSRSDVDAPLRDRATRVLRQAPSSVQIGALAALQAATDAGLFSGPIAPERLGIVVAADNVAPRNLVEAWERFRTNGGYAPPRLALALFDTHHVGCLSEILGARGPGFTVGGASASGNLALLSARRLIEAGDADAVLVCAPPTDFSPLELEAFAALGAASEATDPALACRPFDRGHNGFVLGRAGAAVMLEAGPSAARRGAPVLARLVGGASVLEGTHLPTPSAKDEARAMLAALADAKLGPGDISYINAHGTASPAGDRCECEALLRVFGPSPGPFVNSTKSLVGHCMHAAALVELVACVAQLGGSFLHPNLNLTDPITPGLRFVGNQAEAAELRYALSNSFGFGGQNSSVVLERGPDAARLGQAAAS